MRYLLINQDTIKIKCSSALIEMFLNIECLYFLHL